MTTLRQYLEASDGHFTSLNHPVVLSGREMLDALHTGTDVIPGRAADTGNLLDLTIEVAEQPSGDRWIYPQERDLEVEGEPILIQLASV